MYFAIGNEIIDIIFVLVSAIDLWGNFHQICLIFQQNIFPHFTAQCDVSIIFIPNNGESIAYGTISLLLTSIQNVREKHSFCIELIC